MHSKITKHIFNHGKNLIVNIITMEDIVIIKRLRNNYKHPFQSTISIFKNNILLGYFMCVSLAKVVKVR